MQKKLPTINSAHGSETRNIINELIKLFNDMGYTYNESLKMSNDILIEAKKTNDMNKSVQQQINTLIAESGTSDAETLQARTDSNGVVYPVIKERIDAEQIKADRNTNDINTQSINVKYPPAPLIGAKFDGVTDDSIAINNILNNKSASVYVFPEGRTLANIVIPRTGITIKGQGKKMTEIKGNDDNLSVLNTNRKLYISIEGVNLIQGSQSLKPVLDMRDSRYTTVKDLRIRQETDSNDAVTYKADGIDMRNNVNSWVGYNRINDIQVSYCKNGLITGTGLNSVLSIVDSVFSQNGYFGLYLDGVGVGFMSNLDVAGNGKLMPANQYDETKYGGTYINGSHIEIHNVWSEYNAVKGYNLMPNNIFITKGSNNVTYSGERGGRTSNDTYHTYEEVGNNQDIHISDKPLDDGKGKERINNLVTNGSFKYFDKDGKPLGWHGLRSTPEGSEVKQELVNLPKGYETGLRIRNSTAGVMTTYQNIYVPGSNDSVIKDIGNYEGKNLTVTFWVKNISANISPTDSSGIRAGISTDTGGVYFTNGQYQSAFTKNKWVKVVITRKILGDEPFLRVGIRNVGDGSEFIVTGFSCSFSNRVHDDEGSFITDSGGVLYDDLIFENENKGIVLKSENGNSYQLTVNNSGEIVTNLL